MSLMLSNRKAKPSKTMMAAFHLHNLEVKYELKDKNNGEILPFCPVLTYLGVKLDRALAYHHHLEALCKNYMHILLLRQLAGTGWGAGAKTLCTAALYLIYSTPEYCAPSWCCNTHTRLIDSIINDALCIVTGSQLSHFNGQSSSSLRHPAT